MNKSVRMGKNAPLNATRPKQYRGKAAAYQSEQPDRLMVLVKEAAVILLCTLALFLALALVSYNPKDAGWSHTALEQGVHNAAGPAGAWMADVLFMMLGYFAYLFPVLLALKALQLFHNRRQGWGWNGWLLSWRLTGLLLLIISGSAVAFIHFQPMAGMPASSGGVVGQGLGGLALAALNVQGSTLLFSVLFLFGLTLFADLSWFQILDVIGRLTLNLLGWSKRRLQGLMEGLLQRREARRQQDAERRSQLRQRLLDDESEIRLGNAEAIDEEAQYEAEARDWSDEDESDEISVGQTGPTLRAEVKARHGLFDWQKPAGYQTPSLADDDEPVFYNDLDDEDEPRIDWGKTRRHATAAEKPAPNPVPPFIPECYDLDTEEPEPVPGVAEYYEQLTGQPMPARPVAEQPAAKHTHEQPTAPGYHDQPASNQPEQKSFVPGYYQQPVVKYASEPSHQVPSVPEYYQQLTGKPMVEPPAAQSVNPSGQDDEALQLLKPPLGNAPGGDSPSVVTHQPAPMASHATPGLGAGAPPVQPQQGQHGAGQSDLPPLSLLDPVGEKKANYTTESLENISRLLEMRLKEFGVQVKVEEVHPGPVITRFEIQPAPGVKVSRIANLAKDLARSLAVYSVRVVEVIPGKTTVGIEIPNEDRQIVRLAEVLGSDVYRQAKSPVTLALGEDIGGNPVVADLAKMPHLLVAGTTGSGKSVGVNAMLLSILFESTPQEARLIMIDPKMLELSVYEGIPHLLCPVVTDMKEAANALRWCVAEMERRYKLMAAMGVRNLAGFNRKVREAAQAGEPLSDPLYHRQDLDDEPPLLKTLPTIVVVVDEFADMMMIVGKKVEELIARIAQKARAAGIHLILATQRPSVDVITGLIKANIPTRIAFQVSSKIDSRTILDQGGAEQLLGYGDMLYLPPGVGMPIRVHGAFVSDDEVHRVVEAWKQRGAPDYIDDILSANEESSSTGGFDGGAEGSEEDPLYDEAVRFVTETRRASISSVQRKLKIGYNRAARMIEAMEMAGIVTPMSGNGSREVVAPAPIRD